MATSSLQTAPIRDLPSADVTVEELTRVPGFESLPRGSLERAVQCMQRLHAAPGEILFRPGDSPHGTAYIIEDGSIQLTDAAGATIELGQGAVLGLSNYLDGSPYSTTATAASPASCLTFSRLDADSLQSCCPFLLDVLRELRITWSRQVGFRPRDMEPLSMPARSLFGSQLITCARDTTLRDAFDTMQSRKIGSLGVMDSAGHLSGLVTYRDLCRALIAEDLKPDDSIGRVHTKTFHTVTPKASMRDVQAVQHALSSKYVVVMDDNKPLGVISQTDILGTLISQQTEIVEKLQNIDDIEGLARERRRVVDFACEIRDQNRFAGRAARAVSEFHLAIQRRCVQLTLRELERDGRGQPPIPYALIIMGSGGRKEMLLNPDQDNGLILGDQRTAGSTKLWFAEFAERVNVRLDQVGYTLCPGQIMARNPMFHRTLDAWKSQVSHIADNPTHKAARWANVVFDFDTLFGDDGLTQALRQHVYAVLRGHPLLLRLMVEDDAEGHPAVGLFNRLLTDRSGEHKGMIDIKRNGLRILVDAVRIYALQAGIGALNTIDRVSGLVRERVFDAEFGDAVMSAYDALTDVALTHQLAQMQTGEQPDRLIKTAQLTPMDHEVLRMAMLITKRLQGRLQSDFNTVML